jgi:phage/plasmid primase-like uncharacterized protein
MSQDFIADFHAALTAAGLDYPGQFIPDGKLHRIKCGDDKEANSWYVLFPPDPVAAGSFGCWKRDIKETAYLKNGGPDLSNEDWKKLKVRFQQADDQRDAEDQERHKSAQQRAKILIEKSVPVMADHPYLTRKRVGVLGDMVASHSGELLLPLRDHEGTLHSLQTITADGEKRFLPGGKVQGCFYVINHRLDCPVIICEGYATGATIFEATGWCVVAAMNSGNLKNVAELFRKAFPDKPIIIAADNDERLLAPDEKNRKRGVTKAKEAAETVKGLVAIPQFPDTDQEGTDFNDLANSVGIPAVEQCFEKAYPSPLSILTFDEIQNIPTPESDRILGDHLLDRGSSLVIAGSGGTGKSRLVYQLIAECIQGNETWLGQIGIHLGSGNMQWLILQTENSPRRLKQTRASIKEYLKDNWSAYNRNVHILTPLKDIDLLTSLDNPEVVGRFKTVINKISPDVIVFDSLYDFSIGDINKDADMRQSLMAISRLAKYQNPKRAIIILQHALTGQAGHSKAVGFDRASFARNSKTLYNWTRAQINLAPVDENNNDSIIIACGKCSDGQEFPPFAVTLDPETMIYAHDPSVNLDEWRQTVGRKSAGRPASYSPLDILSLIPQVGISNDAWQSAAAAAGIPRRSFYSLKKILKSKNQVFLSKVTDLWTLVLPHS